MKMLVVPAAIAGMLLTSSLVLAAGTDKAKLHSDRPAMAAAEKAHGVHVARPPHAAGTVSYNGALSATDPTYNRTIESCASLSGVGTDVFYSDKAFTVDTAGSYDFSSTQSFDGMIFLYTGAFDPNDAVTNCTDGNDDGASGIGTSELTGIALATGTTYHLVTAAFDNGDTGTFTNTISGPGNASLPNFSFTKSTAGVSTATYAYDFALQNTGTTNETGVTVTDTLPAGLTYVSDTCGGSFAAGVWTWNVGAVNQGASASCSLTVSAGNVASCPTITNTATLTSASGFTATASTNNAGPDAVADGGFEGGTPSADWTEASDTFGTPICDASCSQSPDNTSHTGDFWVWFGGVGDGAETGSVSQSVTVPTSATELRFWVDLTACNAAQGAADFVRLSIDGTEVWREDATSSNCGETTYHEVVIPLTAYADGNAHTLEFYSEQTGLNDGEVTNMFIDDVSIPSAPVCVAASDEIFADGFEGVVAH